MEFPSAKDLDVTSEDMDNCPPGMTLSMFPHCREYMQDPMWFDQIGRDPIRARKIFRRWDAGELSREDLQTELTGVLEQWPRYGPAVFEKAAKEGRLDVVDLLLDMNIECDPKTMKGSFVNGHADQDDDEPLLQPEHAYLAAIVNGHLDIVKLLVGKGGVPVDYEDKDDGLIHIIYAVTERNVEITRWLLDNGATITLARDGGIGDIGDIEAAIKSGKLEILEMLLAHPQVVAGGFSIKPEHLRYAAFSGDAGIVRYVLQSDCFGVEDPDAGLAGRGEISLEGERRDAVLDALASATYTGVLDCVKLLLKQLTPVERSGSFTPFLIPDAIRTAIYNNTDDALDREDNPDLFELLWDTVLHQEPSQESIDRRIGLPAQGCLDRRLISTAAMGCVKTVKLLVEKYGVDVNHVSHKYFSTPLGRAAGSGANPLPGRLEVVEYLCSRPNLSIELSSGEFCNGETALGLAVMEASQGARRQPELADMVRLLLSYGGPVDEVTTELRERVDAATSEDTIAVHVLWASEERRKPVTLSTDGREGCFDVVLEYSPRDSRNMLRNVRIRSDDQTLRPSDPRGRPLMPRQGEQLAEEDRAKPTMLQDDTVMADA